MLLYIVTAAYLAMRALLAWGLLRHTPRNDSQPRVSVVIAAHNEAEHLPALLESLARQSYPDVEVIIVDDRSDDATPALLESWQARDDRLTVVRLDDAPDDAAPKMHALARGIERSRGELLLFTDADCVAPPDWIAGIAAAFGDDVGAVIGYVQLDPRNATLMERVQAFDYFHMMALTASASKLGAPLGAGGANLAYRRAAYESVGGFDAMPRGAIADDMLLLQRVMDQTAWRAVFCDDSRTFISTPAEPTLKRLLQQRARWMQGGSEVIGRNWPLLATSTLIGAANGLMLFVPLFLALRALRWPAIALIAGRAAGDLLHLGIAARRLRATHLLRYLPLWIVVQLPYTLILPIYSRVANWSWGSRPRE
jgi:cellulose synthase/poly-beta-1,6-N-acetylglucosamine synthase-like glycosyltransferase